MSLGTLGGIFVVMFLLELPDKTMIAIIVMSSRARAAAVAIGASLGFVVQMAIAVAAGGLLTLLPHTLRQVLVAALFLGGAAYLLFWSQKEEVKKGTHEAAPERRDSWIREAATAAGVIFLGEFGDLTQIQAANFAVKYHQPLAIFLTCALAMIGVATVGAFTGQALQRRIPLAKIRLVGGLIFAALGLYSVAQLINS